MTERIALVEKVRQLPKCDYYTPSHVYRFFRNLRARREQAERATTMNPDPLIRKLPHLPPSRRDLPPQQHHVPHCTVLPSLVTRDEDDTESVEDADHTGNTNCSLEATELATVLYHVLSVTDLCLNRRKTFAELSRWHRDHVAKPSSSSILRGRFTGLRDPPPSTSARYRSS
ncbi:hypothetical protein L227DRAFT_581048 [Lentinus tigrinus ALCF2SS1-6]|uniref:Uncharacterized protein n=1 Tax=Lentinus tigrinus ALCF2SS1-6 TaxID=1328759 RepID=A0A5C2RQ98_9APHY|nr:hypothetical protein L227DRAFT_581048 [Lentinus tigrinus ALCF2SS1-6]